MAILGAFLHCLELLEFLVSEQGLALCSLTLIYGFWCAINQADLAGPTAALPTALLITGLGYLFMATDER